ncbi:MAG: adenylate/guanylate cyclase domain-containing protein [Candidatus Binataceae bacterium]
MLICSSCGTENPDGMKFCGNCAAPLGNRCSNCGFENPTPFKFCGQCGTPLRTSAPATPPSPAIDTSLKPDVRIAPERAVSEALDGERKTVTALFADIKGSMDLMEELDPEEARAIVDPALRLMIDSVHHYDGYIVQSTGDGIFALFGAPIAREDHTHRGLYAALKMQHEMRRYSSRLRAAGNPPIEIRVGLNTGEVVVRSILTGDKHTEYTPIGHSTSLAARMQTLAPTGSIAITEAARKLAAGYFDLRALGPTRVKGVTEPVNVYEVLGLGALRTRLQISAQRGLSRFVGRHNEMDQLGRALGRASGGHGQIVAAVAEAGVGKSRLFHEFKSISQSDCFVMEGFSVSHGRASAYLPVIELLKGYFRIADQDDDRVRREKITGKVLALDRALEDTMPYFFTLLGVEDAGGPLDEMDPVIRRRRTREAIKRLVHRESVNQPLLLIFEDLHWVDGETQALLDILAESIGTARILMMVNYRPEYEHHWGNKTYYTQLRLDPLGRENAAEMLSELLGDTAELRGLKDLVIARTEGNPFFTEEMVQALFDQNVLTRNGTVKLIKPLASIQIPPTVQGILAARIDQLTAGAKELLQTLAVIGKEFPLGLVRRVTRRSEDELSPELARLQLGEFIYEKPAFPESEYTFKHALTQEVAYNSLLIERRRQVHERAAAAIEELFAEQLDDHLGELAHHYGRSGNAAKAVGFLRLAAEQARARSAYDDALRYVNEALGLLAALPDSPERDRDEITIQGIRGPLLSTTQGFASAELVQSLNRGLALCQRVGEGPEMITVMFGLCMFNLSRNRLHDAMSLAEKILNLSRLMNSELAQAGAHFAYGSTSLWRGEFSAACEHLEQAIAIYDRDIARYLPMHQASVVPSRCQISWALWMMGHADQAYARIEEALDLATRLGRPFSMAFALMYAIALAHFRRDYTAIRPRAEALIEIARSSGFPYWSAVASMVIGRVLVGEGNHNAGIIRMREAMTTLVETGGELIYHYALSLLAESYLNAREPEKGLAAIAEALKDVGTSGQRLYEAEIWRLRGELMVLHGGADLEAEQSFQHAMEIARRQQARSWELRVATSLARFLSRRDRAAEAKSILAPILASVSEGRENADFKDASSLAGGLG